MTSDMCGINADRYLALSGLRGRIQIGLSPLHRAITHTQGYYPYTGLLPSHRAITLTQGYYPYTGLLPLHRAITLTQGYYPVF